MKVLRGSLALLLSYALGVQPVLAQMQEVRVAAPVSEAGTASTIRGAPALTIPTESLGPGLSAPIFKTPPPIAVPRMAPAPLSSLAPAAASGSAPLARGAAEAAETETEPSDRKGLLTEAPDAPGTAAKPASGPEPSLSDKELIQLRERVERDVRAILRNELGGDMGRPEIAGRIRSVLRRVEKANGIDSGAAALHIGSTFIPDAFTTITDTEVTYLKEKGRLQANFKNSNIFISRGLIDAFAGKPDATLALATAHELAHNRLGHLKTLGSSSIMLGHLLEYEADAEGLYMIARAGYDPREALETLDLIESHLDKLKETYPLLRHGENEFQKLLMRWRDVHPNHALRRANLEDHLTRALEIYRASPMVESPQGALEAIGKSLRKAPLRDPSARLEEKFSAVVGDGGRSFYEKIVALEGMMTQMIRQSQKTATATRNTTTYHYVKIEDQLIVENSIRALAAKAADLTDLNNLFQIHRRIAKLYPSLNFPSHKAIAAVTDGQIGAVGSILGPRASVSSLGAYAGQISLTALQALFTLYLKRVDSLQALDAALEYFGQNAMLLGYSPGDIRNSMAADLGRTLIRKSLALAVPENLPPDERLARAVEYLRAKVPAILLVAGPRGAGKVENYLSTYLKAELIDYYFTGRAGSSPTWTLPEIALLLEGKSRAQIFSKQGPQDYDPIRAAGAMVAWNQRYFKAQDIKAADSGDVIFNYERLDASRIVVPKASDLLEILSIFPYRKAADREKDETLDTPPLLPLDVPETLAAAILQKDAAWQESFWEEAGEWILREYAATRQQPGSRETLTRRVKALGELQASVVGRSRRLAPLSAALRGIGRAIETVAAEPGASLDRETLSLAADYMITYLVNSSASDQLELARDSKEGVAPSELQELTGQILKMDRRYSSFNTTERLRTLGSAFHYAALHDRDLAPLAAYVLKIHKYSKTKGGGRSGGIVTADFFKAENKALFKEAGLSANFAKLPDVLGDKLTSGALGLIADPRTSPAELLGASFAVYLNRQMWKHGTFSFGSGHEMIQQGLALILLEEAGRRIRSPAEAQDAAQFLRHAHDLDPLFISYLPRTEINTNSKMYGSGSSSAIRSEVLGSLSARKQPFRERDAASTRGLLLAIQKYGGWPQDASDQLVLLDWAARVGDYDAWMEDQVLHIAESDPGAFASWAKQDSRWTRQVKKAEAADDLNDSIVFSIARRLEHVLGLDLGAIRLPELRPTALRIIRNPVSRARLYLLLNNETIPETISRRLSDLPTLARLTRAFWSASRYYSTPFLYSVVREASPDARIVKVLQETSRIADAKTAEAEARWRQGTSNGEDVRILQPYLLEQGPWWRKIWNRLYGKSDVGQQWAGLSESERQDKRVYYRGIVFRNALTRLMSLHDRFAAFLDPELGSIIVDFPEPNRTRDDLLERLAKARRLTPERLAIIESYKSYRLPDPLRFIEKQFLETASVQLAKLSPSERVDMILQIGGVRRLPEDELAHFESKMFGRDQRLFVEKNLNIHSFREYLKYLDLLHPEDKELFVKSMFYGKNSIADEPAQIERLYRAIAIDGRGLPALVERVLLIYFRLMTPAERIKAIVHLSRNSRSGAALDGPQIVKSALEDFGITGAKIGQVFATHKGLLPVEYAAVLESFKDGAQSLEKAKVAAIVEKRLALLRPASNGALFGGDDARRQELVHAAQALYPTANPRAHARYAAEILALERIQSDGGMVSDIKEIGRELGSGSVKIAYKVTLKNGTVWVAKIRRPGATIDFEREFEILEALTKELMDDPALKLPNLSQLAEEVRTLVRSELDFRQEAVKNLRTAENVVERGAAANRLKTGGAVIVPNVHADYLDEDLALDEFVPSVSFKDLPERSLFRVSRRSLARAIIDEAAQGLIVDEYLDPDRHSGNILQKLRFGLPWALRPVKPVWIDLGQSVAIPFSQVRPLLKTGLALQHRRPDEAAESLSAIFTTSAADRPKLIAILQSKLSQPGNDFVQQILDAIVGAEGGGYLVRPEQASLEKAIILLNGYAPYLPTNYFMHSLERAVMIRALRRDKSSAARLAWYRIGEFFGRDRYAAFQTEIDRMYP